MRASNLRQPATYQVVNVYDHRFLCEFILCSKCILSNTIFFYYICILQMTKQKPRGLGDISMVGELLSRASESSLIQVTPCHMAPGEPHRPAHRRLPETVSWANLLSSIFGYPKLIPSWTNTSHHSWTMKKDILVTPKNVKRHQRTQVVGCYRG